MSEIPPDVQISRDSELQLVNFFNRRCTAAPGALIPFSATVESSEHYAGRIRMLVNGRPVFLDYNVNEALTSISIQNHTGHHISLPEYRHLLTNIPPHVRKSFPSEIHGGEMTIPVKRQGRISSFIAQRTEFVGKKIAKVTQAIRHFFLQ